MEFAMSHAVDFLIPFRSANWRIGISPRRQLEKISCSSGESISIVIFPYFEKKKQIGFERTINSSLTNRR